MNLKTPKWYVCMVRAYRIAIIGGGPTGIMTAALLDRRFDVTIFDPKPLLATILPTGGGKCNLTHAEYDFKEFAKNYPRGEKFLYSIFSRYCMPETIEYFEKIGVKTTTKENGKIFPVEMSSKFVREKLLEQIKHCHIEKEFVKKIEPTGEQFITHSEKSKSIFDIVIITTGGHGDFNFIKQLGLNVIEPKPALTGLCTKENFEKISGIVLKNISNKETCLTDDLLFTHFGVSGPLIFKISSLKAHDAAPYSLNFNITNINDTKEFQDILNKNPHKEIKNILSEFLPKNFVTTFLQKININETLHGSKIDGKTRDKILENMKNFTITITSPRPDGETVMAGGIDLKEINPKTLEAKKIPNIYFGGEVLDIDGFCGGFNLQNCWSNAFIISETINAL